MIWILLILLIGIVLYFSGCTPITPTPDPEPIPDPDPEPEPIPDPVFYKWHLVDMTTERWARYFEYMQRITKDSLMALEMMKRDENGKHFYVWTEEEGDYWDLPDEVWESGKVDCDGFARLTADGLGRFAKYPDVWWLEYYGYYRYYDPNTGEFAIDIGGHAITVYLKNGELLAFSNTNWWWNKNFQDFVEVGEMAFPEGIVYIRCRHWETGKLLWVAEAPDNEILEGSNVFDRDKKVIPHAPRFDKNNLPNLT